jgi:hypothetical protein
MVLGREVSSPNSHPATRQGNCLCAYAQGLVAGIRPPAVLARQVEHRVGVSVHLGTARFEAGAYTGNMHRLSIKAVIAMLWVVAVTIAVGNVNSLVLWTVLAVVALLPPVVIMRWWSEPRQSMSQSIQEALR